NVYHFLFGFPFDPLPWRLSITPIIDLALVDPIRGRGSRGLERILDLNFGVSKHFGESWKWTIGYEYLRKWSKLSATYAFSKHIVSTQIEFSR
ncbi:MAG: hypothetical protein AAB425_07980, partial [Bdellovibrionota bacterium]